MRKLIVILFAGFLMTACSKKIEEINYGEDVCEYCGMTIVNKEHASQLVTDKGRNHKFDASECMIQYVAERDNEEEMLHILSADYLHPEEDLIDVNEATFLISENIPSPMGANLSAIKDKEEAEKLKDEESGELFSWNEIKKEILSQPQFKHQ